MNMKNNIAKACAWIATGIAVSIGIIITKDPTCLLAFIIVAVTVGG